MFGNRKKEGNSRGKEKKDSFIKSLTPKSIFKTSGKTTETVKKEENYENKKHKDKKQLETDWRNTCAEMNVRARNLQVNSE